MKISADGINETAQNAAVFAHRILYSDRGKLDSFGRVLAWVAIWVVAFAVVGYLYRWTSLSFSHDSLYINESTGGEIMQIVLNNGRFVSPFYYLLRGGITSPLFIGVLSTIYLTFAITFIVRLFGIENKLMVAALCGVLTVNACVTLLNATYIKDLDCYMLAFLFSVLGVFAVDRWRFGAFAAAPFLVLSLGLYQAYIQVNMVLMVLLVLLRILDGKSARDVLALCGKMAVALLLALASYFVILKLLRHLFAFQPSITYNSIDVLGTGFEDGFFVEALRSYLRPIQYLLLPETYGAEIMGVLNAGLLVGVVIMLSILAVRRGFGFRRGVAALLTFALLPLVANSTYLLSNGTQHGLMIYSYNLVYVVFFALFFRMMQDRCEKGSSAIQRVGRCDDGCSLAMCASGIAASAVCFALTFSGLVYANQISLKKDLEFQSTYSMMTRVVEAMEAIPSYEAGVTPVAFVGGLSENAIANRGRAGFASDAMPDDPMYATGLRDATAVTGSFSYDYYFRNILAYPVRQVEASSYEGDPAIADKVASMPAFPKAGYCEMFDETLFVKLS